jgi:hypothetical protein
MEIGQYGQVPPTILCMGCNKPNTIPDNFYTSYFLGEKYTACQCDTVTDAWHQALHSIKTNFMLTNAVDLIVKLWDSTICKEFTCKFYSAR